MAFGIALQKVLAPELRTFVEDGMKNVYDNLVANNNINKQTFPNQLKDLHAYNLDYRSIHENETLFKKEKANYNYDVTDSILLAKLFLPSHMAKFSAFDTSMDTSALLGITINVNDSSCTDPKFRKLEPIARIVRQHRNEWGHVNYVNWTESAFKNAMNDLQSLLSGIYGSQADIPESTQKELTKWEDIGEEFSGKFPFLVFE